MIAIVMVVFDCKSEGQYLVVVAELCHEKLMRLPPRANLVVGRCRLKELDITLSIVLTCTLYDQIWCISTKAKEFH
jgi:hypothetical protein